MLKEKYIELIKKNTRIKLLICELTGKKDTTIDLWLREEDRWVNFMDYSILSLLSFILNTSIEELISKETFDRINKYKNIFKSFK